MLKINLLPKWSVQKNKPYCCYCRSGKQVPLQHLYVSTMQIRQAGPSATSVCIYQHQTVFGTR